MRGEDFWLDEIKAVEGCYESADRGWGRLILPVTQR